jgi:hypothetical protein
LTQTYFMSDFQYSDNFEPEKTEQIKSVYGKPNDSIKTFFGKPINTRFTTHNFQTSIGFGFRF